MIDWRIRTLNKQCEGCQAAFLDEQPYVTRLVFDRKAGYTRGDYCEACWAREAGAQPRFSAWKGVYRVPPPPDATKTVRRETAESHLRALIEANNPDQRALVYILTVMLERQRVLVERDAAVADDGSRVLVYEHRKTGETFVIADPKLALSDLAPVQAQVMNLLAGPEPALPAAGGTAAPPATSDPSDAPAS